MYLINGDNMTKNVAHKSMLYRKHRKKKLFNSMFSFNPTGLPFNESKRIRNCLTINSANFRRYSPGSESFHRISNETNPAATSNMIVHAVPLKKKESHQLMRNKAGLLFILFECKVMQCI